MALHGAKFGDFSLKNESRKAKVDRLIELNYAHIQLGRTSTIELVRDLKAIYVLAKFQNDPWKIKDVGAPTVMLNVRG